MLHFTFPILASVFLLFHLPLAAQNEGAEKDVEGAEKDVEAAKPRDAGHPLEEGFIVIRVGAVQKVDKQFRVLDENGEQTAAYKGYKLTVAEVLQCPEGLGVIDTMWAQPAPFQVGIVCAIVDFNGDAVAVTPIPRRGHILHLVPCSLSRGYGYLTTAAPK